MFGFYLDGGSHSTSFYTENKDLKFDPPVYEQRYCMTVRILEHELFKGHIKKVVDFGCAEMRLLELLKRVPDVEEILEVDIDEALLKTHLMRARPLISDYLNRRKTPLRISVYKGSIDSSSDCLRNADAIIGIEIIEHLYPEVLENVPYNIFGYICPKVAIFSTPNSEFNCLFNLTLPNGFRHDDHKFEWTREQFQDWCYNICTRFPNYEVSFLGAGEPPPSHESLGNVSQIGVFIRKDIRNESLENMYAEGDKLPGTKEYNLLYSVEFPVSNDERSFDEKLYDDVKYHLNRHINMKDRFFNDQLDRYEVPLKNIFEFVYPAVMSIEELKDFLLTKKFQIDKEDFVLVENVYPQEDDSFHSSSDESHKSLVNTYCSADAEEAWD